MQTFRATLLPDASVPGEDPPAGGTPETEANGQPSSAWTAHEVPVL